MEACPGFPQEIFFNKVLPPEGKTFGHITGIVQDKQGYMWLATKKGLYRYDGYTMISYKNDPLNPNSLASNTLNHINIDSNGKIWLGTLGAGLEQFDPATGIFTRYPNDPKDSKSLNGAWISALFVDHEGILWVGTGDGLDRFDRKTGKFVHYQNQPDDQTTISSNVVEAIYEDSQGELWIGTGSVYGPDKTRADVGGLNRLNKKTGTFIRYMHDPDNPQSLINNKVGSIFEDSKGNFWVGTAGDGLHTMDRASGIFIRHTYDYVHPEKLSRPPLNKQFVFDHITFINEDAAGAIWIGTAEAGLNYYDPMTGKTTHYGSEQDTIGTFADKKPWCAFTSREGVLWIGTMTGNLYRIDPFQRTIPHYPSPGAVVESFLEETGTLWIGTEEGLFRKDLTNGTVKLFVHDPHNPASLGNNYIQHILKDRQGNLWLGTHGGLDLLNKDKETFTHYPHDPKNSNSLSSNHLGLIYEDLEARLWLSTAGGLNLMDRKTGTFTQYFFDSKDTLFVGRNNITYILKDKQGKLWVGSWLGLHMLNSLDWKFKDYLKGLNIFGLCEDAEGNLWVGTNDGLYLYDHTSDKFARFEDPSSPTIIPDVYNMAVDNQKNLWICSSQGLIQLDPQRNKTSIYSTNYGVKGEDLELTYCYKGPNGRLYFSDKAGYFAFYPEQLNKNPNPPEIVLTSFFLNGQVVKPGKQGPLKEPLLEAKEIQLSYNQNVFSFDFTGIHYSNPEGNRHLFMLEKYDNQWRQSGSERRVYYFNVPPGKYTFRVKAANSNGLWAEKSIDIVITPPWWSTWWFRITAVFCSAGIFYGIIRWRIYQKFRQQLQHAEKEKQLAELQHKTVELEMQALRAQMNPHFIFNCLSSINGFILKNESEPASDYLTKFSRLIRMVLTNSKKTFITLEDELEMLRLYLEMERLRFQYSFEYNISFKNEIDPENIFIPPLLLQPFAENAIWHGLMHKQGEGHLEISLSLEKKILTCIIMDNGIGRNNAGMIKSKSAEKQKSMGLQITKERLALLNQDIDAQTFFNIEDITDDKGNAAGTRVILKMHYRDLTETVT